MEERDDVEDGRLAAGLANGNGRPDGDVPGRVRGTADDDGSPRAPGGVLVPTLPEQGKDSPSKGDRLGNRLTQPTPEQVALVASKASGVLAKRSAEGRAAPWTHAKLTKARKYFPCSVCQPDGVEIEVKAAIQFRAHYRDAGSGKWACLPCWERLESEAAGNTKGVA